MLKKKSAYHLAIVGATGLVGQNFIKVIEEYHLPIDELRLLASKKSAGKIVHVFDKDIIVEDLESADLSGIDVALFSAGGSVSLKYANAFTSNGTLVIDNSSAWRMDDSVPLVVPEVNPEAIVLSGIIANPNCSTIQAVLPLKALADSYGIEDVHYATYQAVSGSGQKGIDDLRNTLNGELEKFYPYNISKTCIPEIDRFLDNGYTYEEMKMVNETRKILKKPDLKVSATCIRVPIEVGHGVLVTVKLKKVFTIQSVRDTFAAFKGITLLDNPTEHVYPNSIVAAGKDEVFVGRIRRDLVDDSTLIFYTVADNVRKGAASNAVQILVKAIEMAGDLSD